MDKYVRLADVERAFCGWCGVCLPEEADPARCNDGLFAALRALETVELPAHPQGSAGEAGEPEEGERRSVTVRLELGGKPTAQSAAPSRSDVSELAGLILQMAEAAQRAEAAAEASADAMTEAIAAGLDAEAAERSNQQRTALDRAQDVAAAEWIVCGDAPRKHPLTAEGVMEALREAPPLFPLVTCSEEDGVPEEPGESELLQAFRAGED